MTEGSIAADPLCALLIEGSNRPKTGVQADRITAPKRTFVACDTLDSMSGKVQVCVRAEDAICLGFQLIGGLYLASSGR